MLMVAAVTWAVWVAWAVWACNQRKLIQHSNCCLMKAPQCGAFFFGLRCLGPLGFMAIMAGTGANLTEPEIPRHCCERTEPVCLIA